MKVVPPATACEVVVCGKRLAPGDAGTDDSEDWDIVRFFLWLAGYSLE